MKFAAESMESSFVTSKVRSSTLPCKSRAKRDDIAATPFLISRLPRSMWYFESDSTSFFAVSNPMPWFAPGRISHVLSSYLGDMGRVTVPVIRAMILPASILGNRASQMLGRTTNIGVLLLMLGRKRRSSLVDDPLSLEILQFNLPIDVHISSLS